MVYKTFKARSKSGRAPPAGAAGAVGLLTDENVQYLLMALVWLYSRQFILAMLPYTIYSVFHVATYTRTNLIPTLAPPKQVAPAPGASSPSTTAAGGAAAKPTYATHPVAESIGKFVKQYYDSSMSVVALLEIVLWGRLFLSAVTFSKGSWILLAVYTAFLRARFAQSTHVQSTFGQIEARIDNLTGAQGMNPTVRQVWDTVKNGVRQAYAATDLQKYVGGGAAAPRKTQ